MYFQCELIQKYADQMRRDHEDTYKNYVYYWVDSILKPTTWTVNKKGDVISK